MAQFIDYDVIVDSPQKHFDPMETYISFRIVTKVKQPSSEIELIVRRRYSDFVWLRNKLIHDFPTLFALPAKHSVLEQLDRYSKSFIMTRMAMLNMYLQRLASHPVFSCSPYLVAFLREQSISDIVKQSKPHSGIFEKLTGSLQNLTGHTSCRVPQEFETAKHYVNNLSQKLITIRNIVSRINKERIELSFDINNAKMSITQWSYQEPELAKAIEGIVEAFDTINKSQQVHLLENYNSLVDQPLDEYISYIEAVKEALYRRDWIQSEYENSVYESHKKQEEKQQLESEVNNGFRFKIWRAPNKERIRKLEQEIPNMDQQAEENQDKMEIANEGIRSDLQRWNVEKVKEVKIILGRIAEQHVLYYKESLKAWEKSLESLRSEEI